MPFLYVLLGEALLTFLAALAWVSSGYAGWMFNVARPVFYVLFIGYPAWLVWRYFRRAEDATAKVFAIAAGASGLLVSAALLFWFAFSTF